MIARGDLQSFLISWHEAFFEQGASAKRTTDVRHIWEDRAACRELRKVGLLELVSLVGVTKNDHFSAPENWRAREAILELAREIGVYKAYATSLAKVNTAYKRASDLLTGIEARLNGARKKYEIIGIEKLLTKVLRDLKVARILLNQRRRNLWIAPGSFATLMGGKRAFTHPKRVLDLDGRFRVRVGTILRTFLPKRARITRRTISRLVVLVYLSAGFVELHEGEALILFTRRKLTVDDVEQTFRRAKLR